MKVSKGIKQLSKILEKVGDVDMIVDTEAGKFPCHMVDIEKFFGQSLPPEFGIPDYCHVSLDSKVMAKVHPRPGGREAALRKIEAFVHVLLKDKNPDILKIGKKLERIIDAEISR